MASTLVNRIRYKTINNYELSKLRNRACLIRLDPPWFDSSRRVYAIDIEFYIKRDLFSTYRVLGKTRRKVFLASIRKMKEYQ